MIAGQGHRIVRRVAIPIELTTHGIQLHKSAATGADPDMSVSSREEGPYVRQFEFLVLRGLEGDAVELLGIAMPANQSAARRSEPHIPLCIFCHGVDEVIRDAAFAAAIEPLHIVSIVAIQTVFGGDPDEALAVLMHIKHRILREPFAGADVFCGERREVTATRFGREESPPDTRGRAGSSSACMTDRASMPQSS